MNESMLGTGPQACLAPLPDTLSETFNVVFGHDSLGCDRQALQHRTMVRELANRTGNEDMATLRRALDEDEARIRRESRCIHAIHVWRDVVVGHSVG